MRKLIWIILWIFCGWVCTDCGLTAPRAEYGTIHLWRDSWGVPHVFSDTDAGAFYGLGYAAAEDRLFQMHISLWTMQGRLAEHFGEIKKMNRNETTLQQDIQMRTMGFYRAAKEVVQHLDAESRGLLEAYSEGVNDFVHEHPQQRLYLFEKWQSEPETWHPEDCIAVWWNVARFFAGDGLRDAMSYHQRQDGNRPMPGYRPPVDDDAAVIQREDVTDAWLAEVTQFLQQHGATAKPPGSPDEGPKFSHAWVVGGSKTTTGAAVLCSDPQTQVRNPSLFYEFHLQGKTLNARGIGVAGSPVILIGWNENVAWGMTALGADQADLFFLRTDPSHPNAYRFDGEWRAMETWQEVVKVKGGADQVLQRRATHLGPVVTSIAYDMRPGEEVALKRIPICERDRETIQGAVAMMRAKNAGEFLEAVGKWRFPSANVVFGDHQGHIGFTLAAAIPVRSAQAGTDSNDAQDGAESRQDWQGFLPPHLMPHVLNPKRGWLASANHRAIGQFYPAGLGLSTGSMGDTDRSWRLRERLEAKDRFTPEDVLDVHFDSVNAGKREILHMGYHMRDNLHASLSEPALNALNYLEAWYREGAQSLMERPGTEVVNLMPVQFRMMNTPLALVYGGGFSGLCSFLKMMKRQLDQDPKLELMEEEEDFVDNTLSAAWRMAEAQLGRDPARWPERAREQVQQRKMFYQQNLDGFSSLDADQDLLMPPLACVDGGTIFSQAAESYSQWVPMHDVDTARSILPFGESEDPQSPFYRVNYQAWTEGKLHPAPIHKQAVEPYVVRKKEWQP